MAVKSVHITSAGATGPDVVLIDYALPDEDGVRAALRIREVRPETKVVMLTAYPEDTSLLAAVEAGCSGYLLRTRAMEELAPAVRAAHAGEVLVPPSTLIRLLARLPRSDEPVASPLSAWELEVLALVAAGLSNQTIAERLMVGVEAVDNHIESLRSKLGAHSKLEAVVEAVRRGIIFGSPVRR